MSRLLTTECFDAFLLSEATITTFTTFHIDGSFHKDYFGLSQDHTTCPAGSSLTWRLIRPLFYELVKGRHTPLNFKLVFRLADYNTEKLLEQAGIPLTVNDVAGLFLNIHYNGKEVSGTTGTSLRIFTLDKSLDFAWDTMVEKFLRQRKIPFC